jgi:hypothetical protein
MRTERPAWKDALLWVFAFLSVSGLSLAIETKAASQLFQEGAVTQALESIRGRVEPQVTAFFNGLIPVQEMREWQSLEQYYGIGLPNFGQEAARAFTSGWKTIVQRLTGAAASIRAALDSVAWIGLIAALVGLVGAALVGGWFSFGEHLTGAFLANGAMCLLVYLAAVAAVGQVEQSSPQEAILVGRAWIGGFLAYQLAVGIPLLILGGGGTLALYFLAPKPPPTAARPPTSRTVPGPRV